MIAISINDIKNLKDNVWIFGYFLKPHCCFWQHLWLSLPLNYWARRCCRQNCFWSWHLSILFFFLVDACLYYKSVLKLPDYILVIVPHANNSRKDLSCIRKRKYSYRNYLAVTPSEQNFETGLKPFLPRTI